MIIQQRNTATIHQSSRYHVSYEHEPVLDLAAVIIRTTILPRPLLSHARSQMMAAAGLAENIRLELDLGNASVERIMLPP